MNATTAKQPALVLYEDDHIDPPFSHGWMFLMVAFAVFIALRALWALLSELALLRRATAKDIAVVPEEEGATILKGRVVFALGESLALRTVIEQKGSERQHKGNWSHSWRETARHNEVRPFYLECHGGVRVRVEASENTRLVDETDPPRWHARDARSLCAELRPGEEVFAEGFLRRLRDPEGGPRASGYRENALGWVMRDTLRERLQISAEALSQRHRWKIGRMLNNFTLAILFLLGAMLLATPYAFSLFGAKHRSGEVVSLWTYRTRTKSGYKTNYKVRYRIVKPQAGEVTSGTASLDGHDYRGLKRGQRLALRSYHGLFGATACLGRGVSIYGLSLLFIFFGLFGGFVFVATGLEAKRWYEAKLNHSGSGRLPGPPGESSPQRRSSAEEEP